MNFYAFKFFFLTVTIVIFQESQGMVKALNTSATGMATQEANVNTIANNIANVNTTGFKKDRAESEDLMYETHVLAGSRSSFSSRNNVGIQIGSGSKISAIKKEFSAGSPQLTNNPFDFMINGDGFFAIILPNNVVKYTRDGSFSVDNTGTIVTKSGYKLFPGLSIPSESTNVKVSENGIVEAYLKNQVEPINVGSIPIFLFTNPVGLINSGGNLFDVSQASGPPIEQIPGQNNAGIVMQGALESSNVSIMTEMTNLIKAQRAYEMNSKVMGVADQMLQTINNIR